MTNYEKLLDLADREGLDTKEYPFQAYDGLIFGNRIGIRKDMTGTEKACVMAEELGHHFTSTGDILDQSIAMNRKQEARARLWSFNKMIGLHGLIRAYEHRCHSLHEMAEYLDVTEEFLQEAIEAFRRKYGIYTVVDNYIIYFEPHLIIADMNLTFI